MPTMANITIKKADGTTDQVWTAVVAASGDAPAKWRNNSVGTLNAQRPELTLAASGNGTGTARRLRITYRWPLTGLDVGGNTVVTGSANFSGSFLVPQNQTPADIKEQTYQFGNLLAAALIKSSFDEGYAPT